MLSLGRQAHHFGVCSRRAVCPGFCRRSISLRFCSSPFLCLSGCFEWRQRIGERGFASDGMRLLLRPLGCLASAYFVGRPLVAGANALLVDAQRLCMGVCRIAVLGLPGGAGAVFNGCRPRLSPGFLWSDGSAA